jgi:hypothetical protein
VTFISLELSVTVIDGISGQSGRISSSIDIFNLELVSQSHHILSILIQVHCCSLSYNVPGVVSPLQALTFSSVAFILHQPLTEQSHQSI